MSAARFGLGRVAGTPGAFDACLAAGVASSELLTRHASGDWGDVPAGDARENEHSLRRGSRLLSSYALPGGERVWVITEADRSSTSLILASEY